MNKFGDIFKSLEYKMTEIPTCIPCTIIFIYSVAFVIVLLNIIDLVKSFGSIKFSCANLPIAGGLPSKCSGHVWLFLIENQYRVKVYALLQSQYHFGHGGGKTFQKRLVDKEFENAIESVVLQ